MNLQARIRAEPHSPLRATLASLHADVTAVEIITAMRRANVEPILLKGAAIALWIYPHGESRPYADTDLLVAPGERARAEAVLASLGFAKVIDDADTPGWRQAAHHWHRDRDGAEIDLHRSLVGVRATDQELWQVLCAQTEPLLLAGTSVRTMSPAARALHVALHASQHGRGMVKPLRDLELAVRVLPRDLWSQAVLLAERVQAQETMAAGLRLTPAGAALAADLRLPERHSRLTALHTGSRPAGAMSIEHFAAISGWRSRMWMIVRKLLPSRRLMRASCPLARRGRIGLLAAYAWRPLWVIGSLPAAVRAWRRADALARAGSEATPSRPPVERPPSSRR